MTHCIYVCLCFCRHKKQYYYITSPYCYRQYIVKHHPCASMKVCKVKRTEGENSGAAPITAEEIEEAILTGMLFTEASYLQKQFCKLLVLSITAWLLPFLLEAKTHGRQSLLQIAQLHRGYHGHTRTETHTA